MGSMITDSVTNKILQILPLIISRARILQLQQQYNRKQYFLFYVARGRR